MGPMMHTRESRQRDATVLRASSVELLGRCVSTMGESSRLVAEAWQLRWQLARLRLATPRLRLLRLAWGSSDARPSSLVGRLGTLRANVRTGLLRCDPCHHASYGQGDGRSCAGCDEPITPSEVEILAAFLDGDSLRFHSTCFDVWRIEIG